MSELINLLKPVLLIFFSFAVIFRLMSAKKLPKIFVIWALGPVAFAIIVSEFSNVFSSVSYFQKFAILIIIGFIIILIISKFNFQRGVSEGVMSNLIYDILKSIILFPMRVFTNLLKIFFKKK